MTLEVELEDSSPQVDDYVWHDFLTERDFRPEDLWEFDCEARSAGARGSSAENLTGMREGPADTDGAPRDDDGADGSAGTGAAADREQNAASRSRLVWELVASPPGSTGGSSEGEDDADADRRRDTGPGDPELVGLSGRVVLAGLEDLTISDTAEALKDLAGLRSWVDAMEARIVSRLADGTRDDVLPHFPGGNRAEGMARSVAASEVAFTLNIPERSAYRLVEESVQLTLKHRATLDALETGSISRRHAVLIADESLGMPPEAVAGFEQALLDQAPGLTVAKLARRARRFREENHPQTLPIRRAKAEAERHVELRPDDDGMAWLHAYLPAEQACGIYQRLTESARKLKTPDEPRTLTQLRADVFTDLLTHDCVTDDLPVPCIDDEPGQRTTTRSPGVTVGTGRPAWRGISAHVNVTVPILAMLDVLADNNASDNNVSDSNVADSNVSANNAASNHEALGPRAAGTNTPRGLNQFAELEGYGPIDAATAARLAAHAPSFTRILTHPVTGSVLDVGRETYRPPKHLQDWIRARDQTCRHPGCNRAAVACEIDHTVSWARGGTTSHCNLGCLCAKHHALKSEGFFGYHQPEPGIFVVRSRAGTVRTSTPDPPF